MNSLNYKQDTTEEIRIASTPTEVFDLIKGMPAHSTLFCDVDDTLITPVSNAFRLGGGQNLIDQIKQAESSHNNFDVILGNWRLQRKITLMHPDWLQILVQLKNNFEIYGLTKVNTGRVGAIASTEKWRYEELKRLGIEFTPNEPVEEFSHSHATQNGPAFYRGIFFTGRATKSEVLAHYKPVSNPCQIIFIDDREDQLLDVAAYCRNENIPYLGIHYQGMGYFTGTPDPDIINFQKDYLIKHAQWLEDEEAEKLFRDLRSPSLNL